MITSHSIGLQLLMSHIFQQKVALCGLFADCHRISLISNITLTKDDLYTFVIYSWTDLFQVQVNLIDK